MITDLLNPSIEQLVTEIVAINHAWKEACELFDDRENSPLAQSLRDLKTCKQIRLLRSYAPLGKVYLALDDSLSERLRQRLSDEPLYSLHLQEPIDTRRNAEHLPVRVAAEYLSSAELDRFTQNN
jgi:hypothetical protein